MVKKDLIFRNPLKLIGDEAEEILPQGGFGAVVARAGVGKTALLVQIALDRLLRDADVLHVSLKDPIDKISLWYNEIMKELGKQYNLQDINTIWKKARPHRFIMSFNVDTFDVPKFKERLRDLTEQDILHPQVVLLDGFSFEQDQEVIDETLKRLKELAQRNNLRIWFAVRTHRHETTGEDQLPPQLTKIIDLFDVAIKLNPTGKEIAVEILKSREETQQPSLQLDPSTMLILNQ